MIDREYIVRITTHAKLSMWSVAQSISIDLQNPQAAVKWLERVQSSVMQLTRFPERVQLTPEEPWHSLGVHRMTVGKYYVYYIIKEDECEIIVTDVILQKMDQARKLYEMPLDDK